MPGSTNTSSLRGGLSRGAGQRPTFSAARRGTGRASPCPARWATSPSSTGRLVPSSQGFAQPSQGRTSCPPAQQTAAAARALLAALACSALACLRARCPLTPRVVAVALGPALGAETEAPDPSKRLPAGGSGDAFQVRRSVAARARIPLRLLRSVLFLHPGNASPPPPGQRRLVLTRRSACRARPEGFHFNKIKAAEFLLWGDLADGAPQLHATAADGCRDAVIINASPLFEGHSLLLPEVAACHNQRMRLRGKWRRPPNLRLPLHALRGQRVPPGACSGRAM